MRADGRAPDAAAATDRAAAVCDAVLGWSAAQGYRGYNKHDGLNSPILRGLLGWAKWPRLIAIQAVMRAPVNLRPWLLVPRTYNPKGLALFAQAWLDRYSVTSDPACLEAAERLLSLLAGLASRGPWSGTCWGYAYPWQDPGFYAPPATPNAVVSAFVCEAFLDAFRVTGKREYLDMVGAAIPFFLRDLKRLKDEPQELCLSYMPVPMRMRVMDVSILIGSVLARHATLAGATEYLDTARRLVRYVVRRQTPYHAWYYTDPPADSHIRHDNYHTGFILDALARYMAATGDAQWAQAYRGGLAFYARELFTPAGAPRWMSDVEYPYDIHGAAQGILTFARHGEDYPGFAARVAQWSMTRMYHPEGRFYYQRTRWYTKRFTLLRWCNAWMARSLARFVLETSRCSPKA
jgi:hypothetical protein